MRSNRKSFLKVLYFIKLWYRCGSYLVPVWEVWLSIIILSLHHCYCWMEWVNSSWFISCLVIVETVCVEGLKVERKILQYSHRHEQWAQKHKKKTKREFKENKFWDNRVIFGERKMYEKFNQTFYIQHFY